MSVWSCAECDTAAHVTNNLCELNVTLFIFRYHFSAGFVFDVCHAFYALAYKLAFFCCCSVRHFVACSHCALFVSGLILLIRCALPMFKECFLIIHICFGCWMIMIINSNPISFAETRAAPHFFYDGTKHYSYNVINYQMNFCARKCQSDDFKMFGCETNGTNKKKTPHIMKYNVLKRESHK